MTFALPIVDQPVAPCADEAPAVDASAVDSFDDWRWQLRNRITSKEEIAARLPLTAEEAAGLDAAPGHFRVAITPYYFSLIDRGHPSCPVRIQVIPRARELEIEPGDLVDPLGEDSHSPATGIFHRYPDRCLLLALDRCAIYCRHCNRRRLVGQEESPISREDLARALDYIRRTPAIRDVLISGGDPLTLSTARLEEIIAALRAIPHVEIIRIGTRVPVVLPMRIDDELCAMLQEVPPALRQHPLQPPQGADAARARRVREAGRRRHPDRQPDGPAARGELVGARAAQAVHGAAALSRAPVLPVPGRRRGRARRTCARPSRPASRSCRSCAATSPASRFRTS